MFESFDGVCRTCSKKGKIDVLGLANEDALRQALRNKNTEIRVMHRNEDGDPPADHHFSLNEQEKEKLRGQLGIAA